ncbi:LysE family translocator (plasmid) [Pseudoalteromonas sp. T1lg65]|uniref:LysE family translocator n=1 Tax=Pseudoalteromonas sp. T1lg65 TaxID=2077101 RepID=UPI003F78C194
MDTLIAITLFAIVSSITPGPNNILVMSSGLNHGTRRSMPLLFGICFGFAFMLLAVLMGIGELLQAFPVMQHLLQWTGCLYMLYLAWQVANDTSQADSKDNASPLGFIHGALLQWINGKAWVIAIGAIGAFGTQSTDFMNTQWLLPLVFLIVAIPCVGIWMLAGVSLQNWLINGQRRRYFNGVMAVLLVLSVLPSMQDLIANSALFKTVFS